MSDFLVSSADMNNLFSIYRHMDVVLSKHRQGIETMDADVFEIFKKKHWYYHDVMLILGLMDEYRNWLKEMGIE